MLSNKISKLNLKTLRSLALNRSYKQRLRPFGEKKPFCPSLMPFCPSLISPTIKGKRLLSNRLKNAYDQKRRAGVFNTELSRQLHKSLQAYINNTTYPIFNNTVTKRMRRITSTRIRNRCVLTGHPQTVGHLGLSRIVFRRLANLGRIPGLAKV